MKQYILYTLLGAFICIGSIAGVVGMFYYIYHHPKTVLYVIGVLGSLWSLVFVTNCFYLLGKALWEVGE